MKPRKVQEKVADKLKCVSAAGSASLYTELNSNPALCEFHSPWTSPPTYTHTHSIQTSLKNALFLCQILRSRTKWHVETVDRRRLFMELQIKIYDVCLTTAVNQLHQNTLCDFLYPYQKFEGKTTKDGRDIKRWKCPLSPVLLIDLFGLKSFQDRMRRRMRSSRDTAPLTEVQYPSARRLLNAHKPKL